MFWTDLHHYGPSLRLIVPYGAAWVPISLKSGFLETPCMHLRVNLKIFGEILVHPVRRQNFAGTGAP